MSHSRLSIAVALCAVTAACAHAPTPPSPSLAAPAPTSSVTPEPEYAEAEESIDEAGETVARAEGTEVLEIEAEDLGGDIDTIVAEPVRPTLPSMMKDIRMGPSG